MLSHLIINCFGTCLSYNWVVDAKPNWQGISPEKVLSKGRPKVYKIWMGVLVSLHRKPRKA